MEERGSPVKSSDREDLSVGKFEDFTDSKVEINLVPSDRLQYYCPKMDEKRMEKFLKLLNEFEKMSSNVEEQKKSHKVVGKPKAENLSENGSEAKATTKDAAKEQTTMVKANSQRITYGEEGKWSLKEESSRALMEVSVKYGSMRKEKEWKRTLGCKLFEERHNVNGGEGMDSLWEAYETDSNKNIIGIHKKYEAEDEGQLLKLSAGKMNLGMGRPNLVKISKAIKGFGWLHHVSKHSKKVRAQ